MTDDTPAPASDTPSQKAPWLKGPGILALVVSVVALGLAGAPYVSPDIAGRQARTYLLAHPDFIDEISLARQANEDQVRVGAVNAAVAANPALIQTDPRDPTFGPANAKVTVIEFFDFRCPGCKAVSADYLRLMKAHPDVRFVFKDWPILDRGGEPVSQYAARAALAAHQQGKYLAVYEDLMAERSLTIEAVDRILTENGIDMARAQAVIASPDTIRHLVDIHTTAATFKLIGTPTFLINGKTTSTIAPEEVLKAIEAAKAAS